MVMDRKLLFQVIVKYCCGILLVGLLLFLPAGTFRFWNAWLFLAILFIPMFVAGLVMLFHAPQLLRKRLNAKEEQREQKAVLVLSGLMFLAAFILAGLNARFGWLHVPAWLVVISAAVFLAGYLMYAEVMRENAYLSRTIEVQENQKVIDTGLYGVVRHPMYSATLLLFLPLGLVLGSPLSFAVMLIYVPILVLRIKNEEAVLTRDLFGYWEYRKKVKYRLIPFIW